MPAKVTLSITGRDGRRILARVPWDGGMGSVRAKRITGCAPLWDKSGEKDRFIGWTYPLDLVSCRMLREEFGDDLVLSNEIKEWAQGALQAEQFRESLRSAQRAALGRVPSEAPVLYKALEDRPFQTVGAAFGAEGRRSMLLADEPGLGKTLQALGALTEAGARRVLVFCRRSARRSVWEAEAYRWLGMLADVYVAEGVKGERSALIDQFNDDCAKDEAYYCEAAGRSMNAAPMRILVCNVEMVRINRKVETEEEEETVTLTAEYEALFDVTGWDAVIFDESHRALIGRSVLSEKVTQTRRGAMYLPLRDHGMRLALSGTPARGREINFWGTFNWLRPDLFTSYWNFVQRIYGIEPGPGIVIPDELTEEGKIRFDDMAAVVMLRRTKAEVAKWMPPKVYAGSPLNPAEEGSPIGVWLDMSARQEQLYGEMLENGLAVLDDGTRLTANGVLAEITRLRQFSSAGGTMINSQYIPGLPSNKTEWVLDFLEERAGTDGKVIIASQFTKLLEMLDGEIRAQGLATYVLTGNTPDDERAEMIRNFQNPRNREPWIFLVNSNAGGESITLDAADEMVFLDEARNPDVQKQMEDRIHRISRDHPCTYYYLRSRGTIEEAIARDAGIREGRITERLDLSRGIEVLKLARELQKGSTLPAKRKKGKKKSRKS